MDINFAWDSRYSLRLKVVFVSSQESELSGLATTTANIIPCIWRFFEKMCFLIYMSTWKEWSERDFFKETHRLPLLQEVAWVMISSLSNTRLLSSMGWWFFPSNGSQIPYSDGGRRFEQVGLTISVVLLGPSFYQEGWIEVRSRMKLPKSTPLCCKMRLRMHLLSKKTPLDESHRNL